MGRVTHGMRARVETQGFLGLSDEAIRDIHYWLRMPPLVGSIWVAVGLLTGQAVTLWALALLLLGGVVLPWNPLDLFYLYVVRPRRGTAPIPASTAPRRFACAVLGFGLSAAGLSLMLGAELEARVFGGIVFALMATSAVSGYCIPSAAFGLARRVIAGRPAYDR